jgi:hypothetical protein
VGEYPKIVAESLTMTRAPITLIALAFLCSCNYRIFTNGQFSHKGNGLTAKGMSLCDSCLVFEPFEALPDSAILLRRTTILSPFFWMKRAPLEYPMIDWAKAEAQKAGANAIWIYNKHGIYNQEGSIPTAGFLSCQDKRKKTTRDTLSMEKGKEYYLVIQTTKGGYRLFETDKHRW